MTKKYTKISQLLNKHQRWCKNDFAINNKGHETSVDDSDAARFCLMGAYYCVYGHYNDEMYYRLIDAVETLYGTDDIADFNDSDKTTFKDIQRVIKQARI